MKKSHASDAPFEVRMPRLEVGKTYRYTDVLNYLPDGEYDRICSEFPRNIDDWPHCNLLKMRIDEEVLLEFVEIPLSKLESQIEEFACSFSAQESGHRSRVEKIVQLLQAGEPAFPLLIQKDDGLLRITEGMHRSVAQRSLGVTLLPVFLMKYHDW